MKARGPAACGPATSIGSNTEPGDGAHEPEGIADPIARAFGDPQLAPVLRWLSLGFVIRGLSSTQQALLIRSLRFRQLAMRTLVAELAAGVVAISLALMGLGVWSLVCQSLASSVFGVVTLWSVSGWRPGFGFRWSHFRELSRFGANIVGFKLLNLLSQRVASSARSRSATTRSPVGSSIPSTRSSPA
jgi:O-antigen/teichoic acid export membrane protein